MTEEKLKEIENLIKKKYNQSTIKGIVGEVIIEDIRAFVKANERMPECDELMEEYKKLPNIGNILGLTDLSLDWLEKFIKIFLKADIEDYQLAEV
jgi:hypothetical protein